jgi:RHS repeat-associated protein
VHQNGAPGDIALADRSFTYDLLQRLKTAGNPESGTTSYPLYDSDGNLQTKIDANGTTTSMNYDELDRLTLKSYQPSATPPSSYAATPTATYTYGGASVPNSAGRLTQVSNGSTSQVSGYDLLGRPTASSQTTNGVVYTFPSYTYNFNNQLKTITYPSGRTITTTYDSAGRTGQVSGQVNNIGPITTYGTVSSYAPHGGIQQMTLGALTEQTCYNNRLQAVGIRLGSGAMPLCGNSADVLNLSFNYGTTNNNGNLLSQTIMRPGSTWTESYTLYDGMNRLTSAAEGTAWSQTYLYDGYGNRAVSGTSTIPNPYATATAITQFANNRWLGTGAAYDNNGNQTALPARSYAYDGENRLASTQGPNIGAVYYGYDGDGRRVTKLICPSTSACTAATIGANLTVYAYDAQGQLAAEYGPSADTGTRYLTADHLGSTRVITDSSGVAQKCYDYYPFGEDIAAGTGGRPGCFGGGVYPGTGPDIASAKFTGKERDWETGLDYFGARYMSSAQGRFSSPDPLMGSAQLSNPQTWNRYTYGLNNPLRNTDPLGLYDWDASAGGAYTDEELEARRGSHDLSRKERNAAENALSFRANFRAGLEAAGDAADASGQATAQGAVAAYGDENDHNGVLVGVAASNVSGSSARTILNGDDTISVNFNPGLKGNELAVTLAHEGRHVGDAQAWVGAGEPMGGTLDLNHYLREQRAWYVSSYIAEALGMKREAPRGGGAEFQVWNSGWKAADREVLRSRGVNTIMRYMGLSPTDTNTYSGEHPPH